MPHLNLKFEIPSFIVNECNVCFYCEDLTEVCNGFFLLGSKIVANQDEREASYKSVRLIHPILSERK